MTCQCRFPQSADAAGVCDTKVGVLPLVRDIFVKAYGGSSRVVRSPPSGR
jgi:hypothetical protein